MNTPQINVTPLIDVLLVLLIIFMVISPLKPHRFGAKIPQPPSDTPGVENDPLTLVVNIRSDSSVELNKEHSYASLEDLTALKNDLEGIFDERKANGVTVKSEIHPSGYDVAKTVFVKAPRTLRYGKVIKVIDAIKQSGASPISLQIDHLEDRTQPLSTARVRQNVR
jgi:biopolymer transport protein TolR